MRFIPTHLAGAYLIEPEPLSDERGFFARTWCRNEFLDKGLNPNLVQCNISYNKACSTLRSIHYQKMSHAEAKAIKNIIVWHKAHQRGDDMRELSLKQISTFQE